MNDLAYFGGTEHRFIKRKNKNETDILYRFVCIELQLQKRKEKMVKQNKRNQLRKNEMVVNHRKTRHSNLWIYFADWF